MTIPTRSEIRRELVKSITAELARDDVRQEAGRCADAAITAFERLGYLVKEDGEK